MREEHRKKKYRLRVKRILLMVLLIVFSTILVVSSLFIFRWRVDEDNIKKEIDDINDKVSVKEVDETNNEAIEIIEQEEQPKEFDPYWEYINMNLISIDFHDLIESNNDTVGWIQVNGTNVNYPFVQTSNNDYYLNHSFNKKGNSAGWVFLDYRNKNDLSDNNNIIYAHGRIENTMFGSLRNALTNGWLKNKDNYVIKISTPTLNTMWQVFSVYRIDPVTDYLQVYFPNDKEYKQFGEKILSRSEYNFDTGVSENDKILTLSTCFDSSRRMVIHAKLIKKVRIS